MRVLIRDDSREVNFQKASCTLDASVKIYSHRVDDTYNASHRILESLSRGNGNFAASNNDEAATDEAKEGEEGEAINKPKSRVRNPAKHCETIEKNPSSLNMAKVEHEYSFDPLFQKMTKAFDEGGAKGMLLYNMRLSTASCSLHFPAQAHSQEWRDTERENLNYRIAQNQVINMKDLVQRSGLTKEKVQQLNLCHKLEDYRRTLQIPKSSIGVLDAQDSVFSALSEVSAPVSQSQYSGESVEATHKPFEGSNNDYAFDYNDDFGYFESDDVPLMNDEPAKFQRTSSSSASNAPSQGEIPSDVEDFPDGGKLKWCVNQEDKARNSQDLKPVMEAFNRLEIQPGNDYDYFNIDELNSSSNAWAGAKHWKYASKRLQEKAQQKLDKESSQSKGIEPATQSNEEKKKEKKSKSKGSTTSGPLQFTLDRVEEELFGKVSTSKNSKAVDSTIMTKNALEKMKQESKDNILPNDEKLQVRDLCRLYLLPNFIVPVKESSLLSTLKTSLKFKSNQLADAFEAEDQLFQGEIKGIAASEEGVTKFTFQDTNAVLQQDPLDFGGDQEYDDYGDFAPAMMNSESVDTQNDPAKVLEGLEIDRGQLVQATRKVEKIDIK